MSIRLFANQAAVVLEEFLTEDLKGSEVQVIDITNCILADPEQLVHCLWQCTDLRYLNCVACPLKVSDLLCLLLQRLRNVRQLHFSLVEQHHLGEDIANVLGLAEREQGLTLPNLSSLYAEVEGPSNLVLLEAFLSFCPNLSQLHVHFLSGDLSYTSRHCAAIQSALSKLENFTFTSDVPTCPRLETPPAAFDFETRLKICANVTYHKWYGLSSCVSLAELVSGQGGLNLPPQLVIVAFYQAEHLDQHIRKAVLFRIWIPVRRLCLVLLPQEQDCATYPKVGVQLRRSLQFLFVSGAGNVVELNINSFHFGFDLDLTVLIQDANMVRLKALSAPPCGLRHPSALQRLARSCVGFEELDVRVCRRGSLARCEVCESEFALLSEDMAHLSTDSSSTRRSLCRLTLSDLPNLESLSFLQYCRVSELRLVNCPNTIYEEHSRLGKFLAPNENLKYLLLQQDWLPFGQESLLTDLSRLQCLRYLCLLTAVFVQDDVATHFMNWLNVTIPGLQVAHVHYRRPPDGAEQRVTWMRGDSTAGAQRKLGVVLRDRPCVLCSTATFIGLTKPLRTPFGVAP